MPLLSSTQHCVIWLQLSPRCPDQLHFSLPEQTADLRSNLSRAAATVC